MKPWQIWVVLGLVYVVFGGLALGNVVATSLAITVLIGTLFIIAGAAQLWAAFKGYAEDNRLMSLIWGLMSLLIGVSFVANPADGAVSITLVVTAFLLASGLARLFMAWRMRETRYFWALLLSGAATIFLAGYIIANFATASLALLGLFFGIEMLFAGAGLIGLGLFLRDHRSE